MRHLAPKHISLPTRVTTSSRCSSNTESEPETGPSTPLPHTPLPYEGVALDFDTDRIRDAINLSESSTGKVTGSKRGREEPEQELDWSKEELEVVQATLRHPFRPLSSAFPPGQLPDSAIIDEITNQILAYAFRGSPSATPTGEGWTHGWDATRKTVYNAALEASRVAHGIEKEKLPRAERISRPGLRRMDSMDFLDQAESGTGVGTAIRLSTSLQNSAKSIATLSGQLPNSSTDDLDTVQSTVSSSSSSSLAPPPSALPGPPLRRRASQRSVLNRPARPTSLLQRGRSYTANELQAEGSISPQSPHDPPPSSGPLLRLPVRITRSQSSILATKPVPHALRDAFMNSNKSPVLEQSMTLEIRSSPQSWSESEDEEDAKPKRTRAVAKSPQVRVQSVDVSSSNLRSPFEEKSRFI